MRILLLNWRDMRHPRAGGAERYVHEIATRWVADGHHVTQFCARPPGATATDEHDGIRIHRAGSRLSVYPAAAEYIRQTAGRWDAIVESVNTRPFFAHRHAGDVPTVAIFHQLARDVWFHESPLPVAVAGRYILEPRWLRAYRRANVVAVSPSTAEDLRSLGIEVAGIAPPGTPVPSHTPSRKSEAASLAVIGRLTASKRPDHAVEAWKLVRREISDATLTIIGDGPMRAALDRWSLPGLSVVGRVDERAKWEHLSAASLLLVPSVREGWGIVVMEAAMCRTPSIAYRVPGLRDSVRDRETGWLCDPTPEQMASTALRALRDPSLGRVGEAAERWARGFGWDETARTILGAVTTKQGVAL